MPATVHNVSRQLFVYHSNRPSVPIAAQPYVRVRATRRRHRDRDGSRASAKSTCRPINGGSAKAARQTKPLNAPNKQRLDAGERQLQRHVRRQRRDDQQMQHAAEHANPAIAATRAHRAEQREIAPLDLGRRRAKRFQNRDVIVVTPRITMRGKRDGDTGEQHREQSAEQQKRLRRDRAQSRSTGCSRECPSSDRSAPSFASSSACSCSSASSAPATQQPIRNAAARLDDFGARDVVGAHQQPRTEVEEAAAAVRFVARARGRHEASRNADGGRHRRLRRRAPETAASRATPRPAAGSSRHRMRSGRTARRPAATRRAADSPR